MGTGALTKQVPGLLTYDAVWKDGTCIHSLKQGTESTLVILHLSYPKHLLTPLC